MAAEDIAGKLEALLDSCRVSCSAFVSHLIMQGRAQSVSDRIYSQSQAMAMLDDMGLYAQELLRILPAARLNLLKDQTRLTELATHDDELKDGR